MATDDIPPLTPAAFQVVLALAGGRAHGYRIMSFVSEVSDGAIHLPPGTLYRTIARLVADGLVQEVPGRGENAPHDARRRYYQLTRLGRRVAVREAKMLARLVGAAADAGLLSRQADTA